MPSLNGWASEACRTIVLMRDLTASVHAFCTHQYLEDLIALPGTSPSIFEPPLAPHRFVINRHYHPTSRKHFNRHLRPYISIY